MSEQSTHFSTATKTPLTKPSDGTGLQKGGHFDRKGIYHGAQLPRRGPLPKDRRTERAPRAH